jgi:hypothetical protein
MRTSHACFAIVAMIVLWFGFDVAAAQDARSKPNALPSPPTPTDDANPGRDLRFDSTKAAQDNAASREVMVQKLRALQQRLKDVDRNIMRQLTQTAESRQPLEVAPAAGGPRAELVEQVSDWQRALSRFDAESICGPSDDSQDVELYNGNLPPTPKFVAEHQSSTAQIQWNSDLASSLGPGADAGNVNGQRWCSGTLVSASMSTTTTKRAGGPHGDWSGERSFHLAPRRWPR